MVKRDTPKKRAEFLDGLATCGMVTRAAEIAGIGLRSVYRWRDKDEHFAAQWDEAVKLGTAKLEDEAYRRAHDGVQKPVYQGGHRVGFVQEYSDTLLIFLLKARDRAKYSDRIEHQHAGNIRVTVEGMGD